MSVTLKDGVGLEDLLFDPGVLPTHSGQVLQHELGALSFTCSRLPTVTQTHTHTHTQKTTQIMYIL